MIILYSAFECNPNRGSDAYVGWSWAKAMSQTEEVHVLTDEGNRQDIEQYMQSNPIKANFHFVGVPKRLQRVLNGRKGYFAKYVIWQWFAYQHAKALAENIAFDIVHHVSIADFRVIGYLWKLKVPFVFGPVGGGQETPKALKSYVKKYRRREMIRAWINRVAMWLPSYRRGIKRAAAVLVSNDESIALMQKTLGSMRNMQQMCELGIDEEVLLSQGNTVHVPSETVHILVSGRLMYRKGLELLFDACLCINTDVQYVVDIYGGGHEERDVAEQIIERGLEKTVVLHGKVPFNEMKQAYQQADVFVLPSLRETTGTAVIEAMANKLPVVALKQNGVKYLVADDAGLLAEIGTKQETVQNLANALKKLIEDPAYRVRLGNQGHEKLKNYTWEAKTKEIKRLYNSVLH